MEGELITEQPEGAWRVGEEEFGDGSLLSKF